MAIVGKYFPGQTPSERIFLVLRRSVFTYLAFLGIALLMAIPLIVLAAVYTRFPDFFSNEIVNSLFTLATSAYILFILGLLLYGFVDYYLDVYILTDERIVDIQQVGFFRREIAELHLREVQDVSAQVKGFFPTLFHYGDILIQTAGDRENFIFYSVPHPYRVSKKIADLHEAQIDQDRWRSEEVIEEGLAKLHEERDLVQPQVPLLATKSNVSKPDQVDKISEGHVEGDSIFEQYSKTQLDKPLPVNSALPEEYYSDRGISDETEDNYLQDETNIEAGMNKIDDYVKETHEKSLEKGEVVQLKEGEEKKIFND